jgi:hypothetical protein
MKKVGLILAILLLIVNSGIVVSSAGPEPLTVLTPTWDFNDLPQLMNQSQQKDYYEWLNDFSVTKVLGAKTTCRGSLIDPLVALSKINLQISNEDLSEQEGRQLTEKILAEQQKYLVFEVFLKNPDDKQIIDIDNWQITLVDDHQNKYLPATLNKGEPDLKQDSEGIFWGTTSQVYFNRSANGAAILNGKTKYLKLIIKDKSGRNSQDIFWIFDQSAINVGKSFDLNGMFVKYFQVIILLILVILTGFLMLTKKNLKGAGRITND